MMGAEGRKRRHLEIFDLANGPLGFNAVADLESVQRLAHHAARRERRVLVGKVHLRSIPREQGPRLEQPGKSF